MSQLRDPMWHDRTILSRTFPDGQVLCGARTVSPMSAPMWLATVLHQPVGPVPAVPVAHLNPRLFPVSLPKIETFRFGVGYRQSKFRVSAAKKQQQLSQLRTRKTGLCINMVMMLFAHNYLCL